MQPEYNTVIVELNHLDAMALSMLLAKEEQGEGLSLAAAEVKPKIEHALQELLHGPTGLFSAGR